MNPTEWIDARWTPVLAGVRRLSFGPKTGSDGAGGVKCLQFTVPSHSWHGSCCQLTHCGIIRIAFFALLLLWQGLAMGNCFLRLS
jgi:hypothetical protein